MKVTCFFDRAHRYKRPANRVAPTTTLEQDWLAAIHRERFEQDSLRPEHRSAAAGPEISLAATTTAPKLNFPPKTQSKHYESSGSFSPSPAFSNSRQQQMSPAASTASHPSSSAIRLQLDIKKSREDDTFLEES